MSNDYKLYTSYDTLINSLTQNGIEKYIKWLKENENRFNKGVTYGKYTISPFCVAVQFHHMELLHFFVKNAHNINGGLDNNRSYYTPLSAIYLIDIYYIQNNSIKNKLSPPTKAMLKKLYDIKTGVFDLLVLNGADINALGLNGKNLLGLELGKPVTHIDPQFIYYILSKGIDPNYTNFITSREIPFSLDKGSFLAPRKIFHILPTGNQSLRLAINWALQPITILLWSTIVTYILSIDDGNGDIFGLYLDISLPVKFIRQLDNNYNRYFKIKELDITINAGKIIKKTIVLFDSLIYFGTNLKQIQGNKKNFFELLKWLKGSSTILHPILHKYKINKVIDEISKNIDRNIQTVLNKHAKKDIQRIKQLATYFKIKTRNKNFEDKKVRKHICNCIQFIKNSKNIDQNFLNIITDFNKIKSHNIELLTGESPNNYTKDEIITYTHVIKNKNKKQKINYSFHISELIKLLQTGINPYNREKIPKEILKEWYDKLDYISFPPSQKPLTMKELHNVHFKEYILSREPGTIKMDVKIIKYNFDNIPDINVRKLYQKYNKSGRTLHNIIEKIKKKEKISLLKVLKNKRYIETKEKIKKGKTLVDGYGIYKKSYSIISDLRKIEEWVNSLSIGVYIHLITWLKEWSYVIIFKLFTILLEYQQKIIIDNWQKMIMSIWLKRNVYTRVEMKNFFLYIFFYIISSGCNTGTLNFPLAVGVINQLNSEYQTIKKIKKFVIENFQVNQLSEIFKNLEDNKYSIFPSENTISLKDKYQTIYNEIINMFKKDDDVQTVFSLTPDSHLHLKIIESNNPGLIYYMSTMTQFSPEFLLSQWWDELSIEEQTPFIEGANIIIQTLTKKVNKIWKYRIQDLLYLITPHNNTHRFRDNFY